jgi:hypothetical protein
MSFNLTKLLKYKHECACLRALNGFKIPQAVPLSGSEISFPDLASKTNLDVDFITRIIRFATTNRIFVETRPGYIAHTAASLVLAKDELLQANLHQNLDIAWPAAAKLNEVVEEGMHLTGDPNQTAFNKAFGTELDLWGWMSLEENAEKKRRFHWAMESHTKGWNYTVKHLVEDSVRWEEIGKEEVVVDVRKLSRLDSRSS